MRIVGAAAFLARIWGNFQMFGRSRLRREWELIALLLDNRAAFRSEFKKVLAIQESSNLGDGSDWDRLIAILDAEYPTEVGPPPQCASESQLDPLNRPPNDRNQGQSSPP
jgi:hypothetical protein